MVGICSEKERLAASFEKVEIFINIIIRFISAVE